MTAKDHIRREEALRLLNAKCQPNVVEHCRTVSSEAKRIAEKIKSKRHDVDLEFVETAALLHDIGRGVTHGVRHGVEGAEILKDHPRYASVCSCHLGGGIDREEAVELGLPEDDYLPKTLEEKIICYADKLVDGERKVTLEETLEKFSSRLGSRHPTIERIRRLDAEIGGLLSGK